jgi:hypothetical protein
MYLRLRVMTTVAVCACATALASLPGTALAVSRSAGWSIHSVAQPTDFSAADSQNQIWSVTVSATGGSYELEVDIDRHGEYTPPIMWDESAEGLQRKLESMASVGTGNVRVTGGPGASQPYTIEYRGALSGSFVQFEGLNGAHNHLSGGAMDVTIAPVQLSESRDSYVLTAVNAGSRSSEGEVTITDKLPAGVVGTEAAVSEPRKNQSGECTLRPLRCTYNGEPIQPGGELVVTLQVAVVSPSVTGPLTNEATVSGGGGAPASVSEPNPVNVGPAAFGIEQVGFEAVGSDGTPDAQAGDHPYGVTTTIDLNTVFNTGLGGDRVHVLPAQEVRDIVVELPLGFVGDPLAAERCPEVDLTVREGVGPYTACPRGSIVGSIEVVLDGGNRASVSLYNVAPEHGYPAELGFNAGIGQPIVLYASVVPTVEGYRLRVAVPGALRGHLEGSSLTIFGDPGEHNGTGDPAAFVTNPTACSSGPLKLRVGATSWEGGSDAREATAYPQVGGCNMLQGASLFNPQLEVQPEQTQADTPSGYEVDLKVPQAPNVLGQFATPELKNASVTLPAGVSLSPAVASGPGSLEACTPAQIDLLGTELGEGHPGGNGSPYDDGLTHASPGHCPEGSRVGEVEVTTPLLEEALRGHVYVAQPSCGGAGQPECTPASAEDGELYGIYMELAGSGVIVKLHGKVSVNSQTGQITTAFTENPQLPFEELKLKLYGGQRASLANPQSCGVASTTSELEPWSAPESGPNATPSWPLTVGGCANPMGLAPGFSTGTVQTLAGGFTPFTMTLTRKDGEQDLAGLTLTLPPGLAGTVSSVPLCPEPQAQLGTCAQASRIGTVHVAAGAGSEPLWLEGPVYLTGSYKGAPFGLSVVVPAKAGPFNLGYVVTRAAIGVDPHTAQVTATSDPLPQIRDGVPLRIKEVNVTVDRPGFIFNPTNCTQLGVTGSVSGDLPDGSAGSTVPVSTPFAVTGCKNLPFKPSFKTSTQGATSRAKGASLDVKVSSTFGEANIAKVHVSLPKLLPSRLETLKLACVDSVFEANPAACPAASAVGTATALTPILSHPLSGPAYLVSHGGAAFPDLEVVLQGEGITLVLDGKTDIKNGITTSTFQSVPDVPVSSFELKLPEGIHSVLAAPSGELCGQSLVMPTTLTGQNGAVIEQQTKIAVTGCKPAVRVLSHKVKGATATIVASVPSAGKLVASGGGLSRAVRRPGRARDVTVTLTLTKAERRFLALHRGRRLRVRVTLRFTPTHGKSLSTGVTVLIG